MQNTLNEEKKKIPNWLLYSTEGLYYNRMIYELMNDKFVDDKNTDEEEKKKKRK